MNPEGRPQKAKTTRRDERRRQGLAEQIMAIGRDRAPRLGAEYEALDHDALLYDENGLPRS